MASPEYKIMLTLDTQTIESLRAGGYKLCVFRGVFTSHKSVCPLIWSVKEKYLTSNSISFSDDTLYGYISTQQLDPGVQIKVTPVGNAQARTLAVTSNSSIAIASGQLMTISMYETLKVTYIDPSTSILQIKNDSSGTLTSGFCQENGMPALGYSLITNSSFSFKPSKKILLAFSDSDEVQPGVYLEKLDVASFLVDCSATETRQITYKNDQWSANGQVWGKPVSSLTSLKDILIEASPTT